ncbi:hypothetical protein N7456_004286 [Penicillium angulare]|uniref:Uncharacterized protein n=1 Tax=Penicillium angulare TaxID=116970 RepID=A0A9W9KJ27_9EURO|nr:hypothetical protein N7456_004286 [Penicillium angulare]
MKVLALIYISALALLTNAVSTNSGTELKINKPMESCLDVGESCEAGNECCSHECINAKCNMEDS